MIKLISFLFCLTILFTACNSNTKHTETSNSIAKGDTIANSYAEAFRIIEYNEATVIEVIDPTNGKVDFNYEISANKSTDATYLGFDFSNVIALSATHIGMIEELGEIDRISGVSDASYLCNDALIKKSKSGTLKSVGDIGQSDIENYIAASPDLIIYSGFDPKAPIIKKMKRAGLSIFANFDWKETHPLGRAEWIKVFGVLFNKKEEAIAIYESIEKKYLKLKQALKEQKEKPSVLVGTMYGDIFNAPAGESYMAQFLKDANVDYVYKNTEGVGSLTISLEELITQNRTTDYWLNAAATTHQQLMNMNKRFSLMDAVNNGNSYTYYGDVNCFWERSAILPHEVLKDLSILFHDHSALDDLMFYSEIE